LGISLSLVWPPASFWQFGNLAAQQQPVSMSLPDLSLI
jgi:hypothetical protein